MRTKEIWEAINKGNTKEIWKAIDKEDAGKTKMIHKPYKIKIDKKVIEVTRKADKKEKIEKLIRSGQMLLSLSALASLIAIDSSCEFQQNIGQQLINLISEIEGV